jgi:hypothetical protein
VARETAGAGGFDEDHPGASGEDSESSGGVPDLIRRFAALGLSGFFTTETALRKALGDTVPQDWVDFAAGQGERTRQELMERMSSELGRMMQNVDLGDLLEQLLEGRTISINARVRLEPKSEDPAGEQESSRLDIQLETD